MEFRLLGPLKVIDGKRVCTPTAPKQRALLAALLLDANHAVSIDRLIGVLWGDRPVAQAEAIIRTYVSGLRKQLESNLIRKVPGGYLIEVDPGCIDLNRFRHLVAQARQADVDGNPPHAERILGEALGL